MMSPRLLSPTAWVSLQADPNTAPRFVAFPDDDHKTASSPLAVREYPTLCPEALMATALSKAGALLRSTNEARGTLAPALTSPRAGREPPRGGEPS
jgi:hypothetical protein